VIKRPKTESPAKWLTLQEVYAEYGLTGQFYAIHGGARTTRVFLGPRRFAKLYSVPDVEELLLRHAMRQLGLERQAEPFDSVGKYDVKDGEP
jgi:hypothetical protein